MPCGTAATGKCAPPFSVTKARRRAGLILPLDEVHRRRADEARDEEVRGTIVEIERRAHLLDDAVMHDDDLVGHGHGLDLVVGDVDRGGLQALVQLLDLGAHLHAQLGVEVGERLVEEEDLRIAHDGAAHGDALALAAGELARIAVEQRLQARGCPAALLTRCAISAFGAPRSFREKAMLSATVMCG